MAHEKKMRIKKLVDRRLQLKLTSWFLLFAVLALGLQYVLTVNAMTELALTPHADRAAAYDAAVTASLRILGVCLAVTLPAVMALGIMATFRLVGPIMAFRRFLQQVVAGERPADLRLRRGDELMDVCELLNRATEPLRREEGERERDAA